MAVRKDASRRRPSRKSRSSADTTDVRVARKGHMTVGNGARGSARSDSACRAGHGRQAPRESEED